jgi:hypothetical protein
MSIWTRLYQHSDFEGRSTFASLPATSPPTTYLRISKSWLDNVDLHDRISSLRVGASDWENVGRVILFQHSHYRGRFASFGSVPGEVRETDSLSPTNFHDITSSALIVRQAASELVPLALGSLGDPDLRTLIRDRVNAIDRLSMRGTPIVTWDMWPGFSPSRKYVYLRAPVNVEVDNWWDYEAELRFWIYLYVDAGGTVRGYVNWYGVWVEGGVISGKIADRLMEEIPERLGGIEADLQNALSALQDFTFVGLYYLPGEGRSTGHVNDDISLVMVKEW